MTSLSSGWRELLRTRSPDFGLYEGVVEQDASGPNSEILVTVLSFDKELTFGPAPFSPRPDGSGGVDLPQRGDRCLIALAQTDQPGEPTVWILQYSNA